MKVCLTLPAMRHFLKFVTTLLGAIPVSAEMAIDEEKIKLASVRMQWSARCVLRFCDNMQVLKKHSLSTDIDECTEFNNTCLNNVCVDRDPGYICSCDTDFFIQLDNTTCAGKICMMVCVSCSQHVRAP